ncbi:WD40/YVTN/BNR-like repeat-containing protein [Cesiribacter andamanensis]|uniref:Ycf48-like protein n=1 Tax=Cesiribacter andamanensis AMV16 TaxID=1279009 RepID=M7N0I8_9BACT|nr:YCF48-related protein [Cesiribacter andamanensis]EMR02208.1 Ycf48-like protein precursor [Cesiribacter andamanensis AMV16]
MRIPFFFLALLLAIFILPADAQDLRWSRQQAPTEASLRGLFVVDAQTVWASGAAGTLLRTTDGGARWELIVPPDSLDFRSLWAFSAQEALIASAGQPARIYRTTTGGQQWQLVWEDTTGLGFF